MQQLKSLLIYGSLLFISLLQTCIQEPDFESQMRPRIANNGMVFTPPDSTMFFGESYFLYVKMSNVFMIYFLLGQRGPIALI